ncbi:MAG: SpoIIE family protein phosphatase [Gammaproteobacteria bacterium]|nr:SpoIIE family protein phosphatase [Gammaproteobacteria bacterium]
MISSLNLTYGYVTKPLEGEIENGDQWLIKEMPDYTLIAVADGLGHGKEAAVVAKKAISVLNNHTENATLIELINECHMELQGTRGTALTLVKIHNNYHVDWLGIGNVIGIHWSNIYGNTRTEVLFTQGGVVGYQLPSLRASHFTTKPGDTLILATDGLQSNFTIEKPIYKPPQKIAEDLFKKYHNINDDAMIVVIHWE